MENKWIIILGVLILFLIVAGILLQMYIDFYYCGNVNGTYADIPRWCWWFR